MPRALLTVAVFALLLVGFGLPLFLTGLVHPSRFLLRHAALLWSRIMLALAGVRLTIEGRRPQGGASVYMLNHQSSLDICIAIVALGGPPLFFAKDTLFRSPVFGWIMWRWGMITVHRQSARITRGTLARRGAELGRAPRDVAVFPEGTRSRDGSLSPFRRGTMTFATRLGWPVVPVAIDGAYRVNHRDRWALVPGPVRVVFLPAVPADEVRRLPPSALRARVVDAIAGALGEAAS